MGGHVANTKLSWKEVKPVLNEKGKSELLTLIADLYSLQKANKDFVHSRYSIGGKTLEPYRSIISESLYPEGRMPLNLSTGKKAISVYYKATKDKDGRLELMVHYLEVGNLFTVNFGDIGESFYNSLESMFARILEELKKQPAKVQAKYFSRLTDVVKSAENIGWGYYDCICDMLYEFEAEYISRL